MGYRNCFLFFIVFAVLYVFILLSQEIQVPNAQDGVRISKGAPLPPAKNFKPRRHGEEAQLAKLKKDVLAKIDIELQRHVAAKNIAGVVALIYHNGHIGYFEAFGWQDIEAKKPMSKDTIFHIMSMSKPIVVVTALVLYDEGKFSLDEPISNYLPEWKEPKVLEKGKIVPAKYPITPRMLMCHSSGLYYGQFEDILIREGVSAISHNNKEERINSLEEFSQELAKHPLKFHPGTGYQYGHSIDILGRYIEAITDEPLDVVIHKKLTGPLKMVDTDFWVPPEKSNRLCKIYRQPHIGVLLPVCELSFPFHHPTLLLGGHGIFSTAIDYSRFCKMLLNHGELDGVQILKPETVDLIFQNHLKPDLEVKYGLGGLVDNEGTYSWGGSLGTQFVIDRKHNFFAIFMVQTQGYKAPTYSIFLELAKKAAGILNVKNNISNTK